MASRTVKALLVLSASLMAASLARAGIYNTTDAEVETSRYSRDYERVFSRILADLQSIPNPESKIDPPIRKRYMLMDLLGRKGALELKSVEQKLDYGAVLIRLGKADEAAQLLLPLTQPDAYPDNFVILSQCATAHFLSGNELLRANAAEYMKEAMSKWPKHWNELNAEQKDFLTSLGWEETAFDRNRRYETYLQRLMLNRLREERLQKKGEVVPETVDPIFVDDQKKPVRFVNDKGKFEVGRIAEAEAKKLPGDSVEAVEQLLIWMPNDKRLFWLLGEVFNASAMKEPNASAKNDAIRNARLIFEKIQDPLAGKSYGREQTKEPYELLKKEVIPDQYDLKEPKLPGLAPDDVTDPGLTSQQWWRALSVGFVTGFAVGLFALWQFREIRRRRQTRVESMR